MDIRKFFNPAAAVQRDASPLRQGPSGAAKSKKRPGADAKGKKATKLRGSPRKLAAATTHRRESPRRSRDANPTAASAALPQPAPLPKPATEPSPEPATPPATEGKGDSLATEHREEETPPGLSEYEQTRLKNIRINQARLAELGLADSPATPRSPPKAKAKSKRKAPLPKVPLPPERRSKRARGEKPDYSGEKIDRFGDELDAAAARKKPSPGKTMEEIVGEARAVLLKSRDMLKSMQGSTRPTDTSVAEKDGWFKQAVHLWGPRVADVWPPSWEEYVTSRLSHPPPPESPYLLLQEFFAEDTWKLLISCVLMSRVSSVETKTRCIGGFFQNYPTPSAALDANPADVLKIISGLGLFETRWRSVVAITQRFLEMPVFTVGLDKETKVYGVGEFGVDSYLIFTQHPAGQTMSPADKNLRAYCEWLKSLPETSGVRVEAGVKSE